MLIQFKKLCQRCGGSGTLFRPRPKKLVGFNKCTDCGGHGVRFKAKE